MLMYVIAIEDLVRSPILRSQVIELLKSMAVRMPEPYGSLELLSLYPLANFWRFRHGIKALKEELEPYSITVRVVPLFLLTRFFYLNWWALLVYAIQAFAVALWIGLRLRPKLLHCRSYPAALVGLWVKSLFGRPFVFDTRALYPEEGATLEEGAKHSRLSEWSFVIWKKIEQRLFAAAEKTTVVSQPSVPIVARYFPRPLDDLVVVPTCTRVEPRDRLAAWRSEMRGVLDIQDRLVVAYVASWFDPKPALSLFQLFRDVHVSEDWFFLLLVSRTARGGGGGLQQEVEAALAQEPWLSGRFYVTSVEQRQVARYLAAADLGALPVGRPSRAAKDPRYAHAAATRISIKFAEYLACGLPVVCSHHAGAAADITREQGIGIVYDEVSLESMREWLNHWLENRSAISERCWQLARERFSFEAVGARYLELYQSIVSHH